MKKFKEFINEADGDNLKDQLEKATTKKAVIAFITSNFFRFINGPDEQDNKSLTMLTAALTILNTSDDLGAISTARRLAQAALQRRSRTGKNVGKY